MIKKYINLKFSDWRPDINKAIAVLNYEPDALSEKYTLKFTESYDQLDYFKAAILEVDSSKQFALVRYRGCPSPGAEIWRTRTQKI